MIKLTVLCDNNTYIDRYYLGEPGFSCLIEDGRKKILFDTGYSSVALQNAVAMGIDPGSITDIVLSHGHNDHTGGLSHFLGRIPHPVTLTACPGVFRPRSSGGMEIGSPIGSDRLPERVILRLSEESLSVSEHVVFLGAIPRDCPFESSAPIGEVIDNGMAVPDLITDDSALAIKADGGIFIVTGCSHSGIINICRRAISLFSGMQISGILGGLHLRQVDDASLQTVSLLEKLVSGPIYPCHCTCQDVIIRLAERLPVREVGVSLQLMFDKGAILSDPA